MARRDRAKTRTGRVLLGILRWLVVLLGLIIALLLVIVLVPPASQWVIGEALRRWDNAMPGSVAWGSIEGSLAAGLRITQIDLHDADESPLVSVGSLAVDVGWLALFTGRAEVEVLALDEVTVHIGGDWQDLAPEREEPKPPSEGYGPDLPVEIVVDALTLSDVQVWRPAQGDAGERERLELLVAVDTLRAQASGAGREAKSAVTIEGIDFPIAGIERASVRVAAHWIEPLVEVTELSVSLPQGELESRGPIRLDVSTMLGEGAVELRANVESLRPELEQVLSRVPERMIAVIEAEGGPGFAFADLRVDLGDVGELRAWVRGSPTLARDAGGLALVIEGELSGGTLVQGQPPIDVLAQARASVGEGPWLRAELEAWVSERLHGERLAIAARAKLDEPPSGGSIESLRGHAEVEVAGLGVDLRARADAREQLDARAELRLAELGRPLPIVASLAPLPPALAQLRGSLQASVRCRALLDEAGRCNLDGRLAGVRMQQLGLDAATLRGHVHPQASPLAFAASLAASGLELAPQIRVDALEASAAGTPQSIVLDVEADDPRAELELQARLGLGERTVIDLRQLVLALRDPGPLRVALRSPTRIEIGPERVAVDGLALQIGAGQLTVDGVVATNEQVESSLAIQLDRLELATLDRLLPGPSLRGRIDARARVRGRWTSPDVSVQLDASAVQIDRFALGEVQIMAAHGASLAPLERQLEPLPKVAARARAEALRVWARIDGRSVDDLELLAHMPLRLRGGLSLAHGEEVHARLALARFDLALLAPFLPEAPAGWPSAVTLEGLEHAHGYRPTLAGSADAGRIVRHERAHQHEFLHALASLRGLQPKGRVDLAATIDGTPARPRVHARVAGHALALHGLELGSWQLWARYDEGLGEVEVLGTTPFTSQVQVRAGVPMRLSSRGPVLGGPLAELLASVPGASPERLLEFSSSGTPALSIDVAGLDVDRLRRWSDVYLPPLRAALAGAELQGTFALAIQARGWPRELELGLRIVSDELRLRQQSIGRVWAWVESEGPNLELELRMRGPLADLLDVDLHIEAGQSAGRTSTLLSLIRASPEQWGRTILRGSVDVEAFELAELVRLGVPVGIGGRASAKLELAGTLAQPRASVDVQVRELATEGAVLGDLDLLARVDASELALEADLIREHRHAISLMAGIPLALDLPAGKVVWRQTGDHRLLVTGRGVDPALLARPDELAAGDGAGPRVRTGLEFELVGGGPIDSFRLRGHVRGVVGSESDVALALDSTIDVDPTRQRLRLDLRPHAGGQGLRAAVELQAPIAAILREQASFADVPLRARVHANRFDLRHLATILPIAVHDPEGSFTARIDARGRIGDPRVSGEVSLHDAAITIVPLRQRLRDIDLALEFDERHFELRELSLLAGAGGLNAEGSGRFGAGGLASAQLRATIDDFPLLRPGLPRMAVSTRVVVDYEASSRANGSAIDLSIVLRDPAVDVAASLTQLPEPIPSSEHVTVRVAAPLARSVRVAAPLARSVRGRTPPEASDEQGDEEPTLADAGPQLRLQIVLANPLLIQGPDIDMAWAGKVAVRRPPRSDEVAVEGQFEARRGRIFLFGNRFDLQRGIVSLSGQGSLIPYLDVVLTTQTPEALVAATLRGRATKPVLEFSSNPAMTDYEILSLLLTGSTEVGSDGEGNVDAEAAGLLAAVASPGLQRMLNQRLGIDRAKLSFGETVEEPILAVGKRITRDVYVETVYHHNAPEDENTAELRVEYDFARRWSVMSYFGDAAEGGIGLFWARSFGYPIRRRREEPPEAPAPAGE